MTENPLKDVEHEIQSVLAEEKGLDELLSQFKTAWNRGDAAQVMTLFHPESETKKAYESGSEAKEKIEKRFAESLTTCGKVVTAKTFMYSESNGFLLRVSHEKETLTPMQPIVKRDKKGKWLLWDVDIGS